MKYNKITVKWLYTMTIRLETPLKNILIEGIKFWETTINDPEDRQLCTEVINTYKSIYQYLLNQGTK